MSEFNWPRAKTKGPANPQGTVLVKHLTLPQKAGAAIPLETQLLHFENDTWRPYSYLWDQAGEDATLVESSGAQRTLNLPDAAAPGGFVERTWRVNATNECKLCHNAGPRFVLGFVPNQLDRPSVNDNDSTAHKLATLVAQGVLKDAPQNAGGAASRLVNPHDTTQSLDDRARSYLHANCGMCHHPGGNAIVSFFLSRELPFDKLNTNKGTGIGTFGMRDAKIIVPGEPTRSVVMYRMTKLGYARMPYIGSRVVDSFGVDLIEQWIRSLKGDPSVATADATSDAIASKATQVLLDTPASSRSQRDEAIGALLSSTSGALGLAVRLHRGTLAGQDFHVAVARGATAPSRDIRGLFETFVPESQRRATLGPTTDPQAILSLRGDAQRGRLIYFSDGARCRACHEIDDRSLSLGPTLREINNKHRAHTDLLQHALQPSLKIDDAYAAYAIETDDGRAFNGLLLEQTEKEVVIRTLEKKTFRISRQNIAQLQRSPKSLMPDGILSDLTAQEAADLFEYIRSVGAGN
jgi:putative heme-binding domain-containing protein